MKKMAYLLFIGVIAFFTACTNNKGSDANLISCDTAGTISYSQKVLPIFQSNCYTCHTSSSTGGGWLMGTHALNKTMAQSGRLLGAINHQSGFSAMPKNGSKLSTCQIETIRKWIDQGALDN